MSGGDAYYTEWNIYVESLVDENELFRFAIALRKLKIVSDKELFLIRDYVTSNILNLQKF